MKNWEKWKQQIIEYIQRINETDLIINIKKTNIFTMHPFTLRILKLEVDWKNISGQVIYLSDYLLLTQINITIKLACGTFGETGLFVFYTY